MFYLNMTYQQKSVPNPRVISSVLVSVLCYLKGSGEWAGTSYWPVKTCSQFVIEAHMLNDYNNQTRTIPICCLLLTHIGFE